MAPQCRAALRQQDQTPCGCRDSHLPTPPQQLLGQGPDTAASVVQFPLGFCPALPSRRASPPREHRAPRAADPRHGTAQHGLGSASASLPMLEQGPPSSLCPWESLGSQALSRLPGGECHTAPCTGDGARNSRDCREYKWPWFLCHHSILPSPLPGGAGPAQPRVLHRPCTG